MTHKYLGHHGCRMPRALDQETPRAILAPGTLPAPWVPGTPYMIDIITDVCDIDWPLFLLHISFQTHFKVIILL